MQPTQPFGHTCARSPTSSHELVGKGNIFRAGNPRVSIILEPIGHKSETSNHEASRGLTEKNKSDRQTSVKDVLGHPLVINEIFQTPRYLYNPKWNRGIFHHEFTSGRGGFHYCPSSHLLPSRCKMGPALEKNPYKWPSPGVITSYPYQHLPSWSAFFQPKKNGVFRHPQKTSSNSANPVFFDKIQA